MYFTITYDLFNDNFWNYGIPKTTSFNNTTVDDTIICIFTCISIWFLFSAAYNYFSRNYARVDRFKRFLIYSVLSVLSYSVIKSILPHDILTQSINNISYKVQDKIEYYAWKLRLLKHHYLINKLFKFRNILHRNINHVSHTEDLVVLISEIFVFLFLVFVLFIFFIITKCTTDSRSLILFIFKDFVFICILSVIFLFYRATNFLNPFRWTPFLHEIWWKDYTI